MLEVPIRIRSDTSIGTNRSRFRTLYTLQIPNLFWMGVARELAHALHENLVAQLLALNAQLDNLLDDAHLHRLLVLAASISEPGIIIYYLGTYLLKKRKE